MPHLGQAFTESASGRSKTVRSGVGTPGWTDLGTRLSRVLASEAVKNRGFAFRVLSLCLGKAVPEETFPNSLQIHDVATHLNERQRRLALATEVRLISEHLLALLLMLKSYRRMGCFPALEDVPEMVVASYGGRWSCRRARCRCTGRRGTAKHHRGLVRKRVGVTYDQAKARGIVEQSIRKEAEAKNRPADLINIALEKVVEAGLELPGFSTFDKMASKIRTEVNASIRAGIHDRMSAAQRAGLMRLLEERDSDGTTLFNRLKKPAKGPTWSHFKNLTKRLEWLDGLGDTDVWMDGVAAGKITDFAGKQTRWMPRICGEIDPEDLAAHLAVPDRAHQPVRRVQHSRARHPARGVRPEARRRLHPASRAGPDRRRPRPGCLNREAPSW